MEDVIDPVCGMTIAPNASLSRDYEGEVFHFCSALCLGRFDQDAPAYVAVSRLNIEGWGRTPAPGFLQPPLEPLVRRDRHAGAHTAGGCA